MAATRSRYEICELAVIAASHSPCQLASIVPLELLRPSPLAVFRLITSSNLVGCSTGRSAGFVPRKRLGAKNSVQNGGFLGT